MENFFWIAVLGIFLLEDAKAQVNPNKKVKDLTADESLTLAKQKNRDGVKRSGNEFTEEDRKNGWCENNLYSTSGTVGYLLQKRFKNYMGTCNLANLVAAGDKNCIPKDIINSSQADLNVSAESADIRGGSLLYYLFHSGERDKKFDNISFRDGSILKLKDVLQYEVAPSESFSSYILTKTCSGYIEGSLEAGVEPPYSSFKASFEADKKKDASLVIVKGTFVSPLEKFFTADEMKTAAMLQLWQFYYNNNTYIDNTYYLKEFKGIIVKQTSNDEEKLALSASGALNLKLPFSAAIKAKLSGGTNKSTIFHAIDWQTIITNREGAMAQAPTLSQIKTHINNINPVFETIESFKQGVPHTLSFIIKGIPQEMCDKNYWKLSSFTKDIYYSEPKFDISYDKQGQNCKCIISGSPLNKVVLGVEKAKMQYIITNTLKISENELSIKIATDIPTSKEPQFAVYLYDAPIGRNICEPSIKPTGGSKYKLEWSFEIRFNQQSDNPVDFKPGVTGRIVNFEVKGNGGSLFEITNPVITPNPANKSYTISFSSVQLLDDPNVDKNSFNTFNFTAEVELPLEKSAEKVIKPLQIPFKAPGLKNN